LMALLALSSALQAAAFHAMIILAMLTCPHIDTIDPANPGAAFANAPTLRFGRSWEPNSPPFSPGVVRMGWRGNRILYYAELTDAHLVTAAQRRNELLWTLGDTFEFFAGVASDPRYIEYHCAPNGVILQLLLPHRLFFKDLQDAIEKLPTYFIIDDESTVRVLPFAAGWAIYGELCVSALGVTADSLRGQEWDVSFSRYDYDRLDSEPMQTSTSQFQPGPNLSFHSREDWSRVKFE